MWLHGSEEAFTIIPNFLITGILAMAVSIAIAIWSLAFVHKKHGPSVFILLFVTLLLVGGGIGQIVFFVPAWAVSTRINKPLTWWRKVLPENVRPGLARAWPVSLAAASLCFLIALEIAIFGFVPGMSDPDQIFTVCWSFLGIGLVLYLFTFVAGFANDICIAGTRIPVQSVLELLNEGLSFEELSQDYYPSAISEKFRDT
jgi:hypothetical protein